MIPITNLYDYYIDRRKLSEQKKSVERIVPPTTKRGVGTITLSYFSCNLINATLLLENWFLFFTLSSRFSFSLLAFYWRPINIKFSVVKLTGSIKISQNGVRNPKQVSARQTMVARQTHWFEKLYSCAIRLAKIKFRTAENQKIRSARSRQDPHFGPQQG